MNVCPTGVPSLLERNRSCHESRYVRSAKRLISTSVTVRRQPCWLSFFGLSCRMKLRYSVYAGEFASVVYKTVSALRLMRSSSDPGISRTASSQTVS